VRGELSAGRLDTVCKVYSGLVPRSPTQRPMRLRSPIGQLGYRCAAGCSTGLDSRIGSGVAITPRHVGLHHEGTRKLGARPDDSAPRRQSPTSESVLIGCRNAWITGNLMTVSSGTRVFIEGANHAWSYHRRSDFGCLRCFGGTALGGEGVEIKITNDGTEDIIVTLRYEYHPGRSFLPMRISMASVVPSRWSRMPPERQSSVDCDQHRSRISKMRSCKIPWSAITHR